MEKRLFLLAFNSEAFYYSYSVTRKLHKGRKSSPRARSHGLAAFFALRGETIMENTGHVRSVNVSERKGTRKKPVESGQIHIDPHHGVTAMPMPATGIARYRCSPGNPSRRRARWAST